MEANEFLSQQKEMIVAAINETNSAATEQSLLDWFAGMALQSAIREWPSMAPESIAKESYDFAEAMMKERERRK